METLLFLKHPRCINHITSKLIHRNIFIENVENVLNSYMLTILFVRWKFICLYQIVVMVCGPPHSGGVARLFCLLIKGNPQRIFFYFTLSKILKSWHCLSMSYKGQCHIKHTTCWLHNYEVSRFIIHKSSPVAANKHKNH